MESNKTKLLLANNKIKLIFLIQMDTYGLGYEQNNKEFELVSSLEFVFYP